MNSPLPPWTRDETILALWVATTRCHTRMRVDDPLIGTLSRLMRSAAPEAARNPRFRNRHGVTRKVWVFANDGAARPLSTLEAAILGEFDGRPVDLIEAAGAAWHALASAASPSTPSRGPVPSTCGPSVRNVQGPAAVYVAELLGASFANGRILAKVGRSGDPQRREVELNFALPPPLGLRWAIVAAWWFEDAAAAHRIEQDILRTEGEAGRSAGGEFLYLDEAGIHQLVDQCRRPCARLGDGAEAGRRQFAPASEGAGASLLYQDERLPRPR